MSLRACTICHCERCLTNFKRYREAISAMVIRTDCPPQSAGELVHKALWTSAKQRVGFVHNTLFETDPPASCDGDSPIFVASFATLARRSPPAPPPRRPPIY